MAIFVMSKVQAQPLGYVAFLRFSYPLKTYIDNPASGKNIRRLNSQMNEGNSPPLKIHANLGYSRECLESTPHLD